MAAEIPLLPTAPPTTRQPISGEEIARAPISLNNVNLVWTGTEVIALGSRLDIGNHASTRVAVGASYDPASDTWNRIADSRLSPQAESAAWPD